MQKTLSAKHFCDIFNVNARAAPPLFLCMQTLAIPNYEKHLVPINPVDGVVRVGCSDKRPPQQGDAVLPGPYYQLLGGGETAWDFALAWEMRQPYGFVEQGVPIEEMAIALAAAAEVRGMRLAWHKECAALHNRGPIGQTLNSFAEIEPSGSAFLRAKAIHGGDMSLADFQEVANASRRLHEGARIITSTETATAVLNEYDMPFATLQPTGDARAFVFSHAKNQGFNVRELSATMPAYISTMPILDRLLEAGRTLFPIEMDALRIAYSVRAAAIAERHILQADGKPYPMYTINEAGEGQTFALPQAQP